MKIKTIELAGHALDWAVAVAEGWGEWEADGFFAKDGDFSYAMFLHKYKPSSDWAQGGPIIERWRISLNLWAEFGWRAGMRTGKSPASFYSGPTPLIAAMRCFVASRLGDEVEIPEELVKNSA